MILPDTSIHVSQILIPVPLRKLVDSKIELYKSKNLIKADVTEKIGVLIDYKVVKTNKYCGGFHDGSKKEIGVNKKYWSEAALFHEVAHALQTEYGLFDKIDKSVLSSHLRYEWQAESVAYRFYTKLVNPKVSHKKFSAYFDEYGVNFLKDWYKCFSGYAEDDFTNNNTCLIV